MKQFLLAAMAAVSLCGYAQLPTEGFESQGLPEGWEQFGTGVDWTLSEPNNPLQPAYTGNRAAYLGIENAPLGTTTDWLITPSVNIDSQNMTLQFYSRLLLEGDQGSIYKVMYAPATADPALPENYTELVSWTETTINAQQLQYTEKVVAIPASLMGTVLRFAFVMTGGSADGWLIDDVTVFNGLCAPPTGLTAAGTLSSAFLTWVDNSGALSWIVEVQPQGAIPTGNGTVVNSNTFVVNATTSGAPLLPAAHYQYFVRAVCGPGTESVWAGPYYFVTTSCPAPVDITMQITGPDTATFEWTGPANVSGYDYYFTIEGNPEPTFFTVPTGATATNSATLVNVLPNLNYQFYVRTFCGQGNVSEWVPYMPGETENGNIVHGIVQFDSNNDGVCNSSDAVLPYAEIIVTIDEGEPFSVYTNSNGEYKLYNMADGEHSLSLEFASPLFADEAPLLQQITFTPEESSASISHCLSELAAVNDLTVTLVPIEVARPGFDADYLLIVSNAGSTVIDNVSAMLDFDDQRITYVSSYFEDVTATGTNLSIALGSIAPFSSKSGYITFNVMQPPVNEGGENLLFNVGLSTVQDDATPDNNTAVLNQVIVNSFDPNDITVHEGAEIYEAQADDYLTYTIRFQNTGNGDAINVKLDNTLDDLLDWETFKPIGSSHSNTIKREGNQLEFYFENINLPFEAADEPGSHGFVTYKVKPKAEYGLNDVVSNTAGIYFDFNLPIVTNTATTTVIALAGVQDHAMALAKLYPNPVKDQLRIEVKDAQLQQVTVRDTNGRLCLSSVSDTVDTNALSSGIYFVKVETDKGTADYKIIKH